MSGFARRAIGTFLLLAICGCASSPPAPPAADEAGEIALAAHARRLWQRHILPRFLPYLAANRPGLRDSLELEIVDRPTALSTCQSDVHRLQISSGMLMDFHRVADAAAFVAATTQYEPELRRYVDHLRASFFERPANLAPVNVASFAAFAGIPSDRFEATLREPRVAAAREVIQNGALTFALAQKIGLIGNQGAPAAMGEVCSSASTIERADGFAFDLVQASRATPPDGRWPAFAMFMAFDSPPEITGDAQRTWMSCRALQFLRRQQEAGGGMALVLDGDRAAIARECPSCAHR